MLRFITFEGGDGTGKSTQLKLLQDRITAQGVPCITTREPGGTSLGELIRRVLLESGKEPISSPAELFLYLADRAQHMHEVILPAIRQGHVVLCDRHTDSTLAYQGYGRGIDLDLLRRLNDSVSAGIKPDLTILLDCPVEIALARTKRRQADPPQGTQEDRFEREKIEFHNRVRQGFLEIARSEPERFVVIDASRSVHQVFEDVKRAWDEANVES